MERSFGTDQDRLVKHLRLAKVKTLQDANKFLEAEYWPEWNERFARPLEGVADMHRALTPQLDLASALSHVEHRMVSNDYTFSFAGRRYQIARQQVKAGMRGKSLRIELHLNGTLRGRFEGEYVDVGECGEGFGGGEVGREGMSQRSQPGRQERLDGRLLRSAGASVMASGTDSQREKLSACIASWSQQGTPGKSGPAGFAFICPKPPLGSLTKAIGLGSSMPSWRSGNTHGFCVTGGHSPIASEPTPSRRLWAAALGATPALRIEHTTGGRSGHSKPELSTLLESGTFYFALTGIVDCLDGSAKLR